MLIPCKEEADIFKKFGLDYIPPELREDHGEIEAAEKRKLPDLIEAKDIRGVFHVHSTWSDGRAPLEAMIAEAERLGWDYVGISDHSRSAAYAKGLTLERLIEQKQEIEKLRRKFKIRIFWGTECDVLKDGSLDYPDKVLADFDFVIASVHSSFTMSQTEMTGRILAALRNKYVTILGHMTGRLLLEREPYAVETSAIMRAAADRGVAIELNASPHRFDIDWRLLPKAKELGVKISINPDAHSIEGLQVVAYGVGIARKGWLCKNDVINTRPLAQIESWLKTRR
jgi:DNA polymerase (family 10)